MFVKVIATNQHRNRHIINKIGRITSKVRVNSSNQEVYDVNLGNKIYTMECKNTLKLNNVITLRR